MKVHKGQSVSEYSLALALIAAALIVTLTIFGESLSDTIMAMVPSSAVVNTAPSSSEAEAEAELAVVPPALAPGPGELTQTTPAGQDLTATNMAQMVDTSGANGTTELLASQLEQMAKQLLDTGKIDQAQYGGMVELANQGHRIAEIERQVELAAASTATKADFLKQKVSVDGKSYSMQQVFEDLIGWEDGINASDRTPADAFSQKSVNGETGKFISLYQQLQHSGAMSDPQIKASVENLSGQITFLSELTQDASQTIFYNDLTPKQMSGMMVADVKKNTSISQATNGHSAQICTTGNSNDTGTHCSK